MNISQTGIDLIKKFEGCSLVGYKDVVNVPTIGYGHTGGVIVGKRITQKKAEELLKADLKKFVDGVNKLVVSKVAINQNQFDALVSFAFNLGLGALEKSTLRKKLLAKDFEGAAKEFDKWIYADGDIYKGLVNRRNAEESLFRKTIPPATPTPKTYTVSHKVRKGETLSLIAHAYKTNIERILKLNPAIKNPNLIYPNQIIKVPDNR